MSAPVGRTPPDRAGAVPELTGPPGLPATKLVTLATPDAPFVVARSPKAVVYAFVLDGKLLAGKGGAPPAEIAKLATLGAGLSLRPHGEGFLLFWDQRLDQNHVFSFQRLDGEGKAEGDVITLPPLAEGNLAFVDTLVRGTDVAIVYEVTKGDRVNVFAQRLGADLAPKGVAVAVFEGALGWHAAQSAEGIVFVAVENDGTVPSASPALGAISVRTLAWGGNLTAKVPVTKALTSQIDVEVAALGRDTVVAWTDEESEEGAVRVASISADGSVKGPAWVAPPIGEQALVALVSDPRGDASRALVAWENVGQAAEGARVINLSTVSAGLDVSRERTRLLLSDADRPDLVADRGGFAALTLAPPKLAEAADDTARALATDRAWPTLVRLGPDLTITWSEPVRFAGTRAEDGIPDAAWGLTCDAGSCGAIAADGVDPTSFFWAEAATRESVWVAPAWRSEDERGPRVLALRTVMRGERVAAAQSFFFPGGKEPSVGWVTYFQPGMSSEAAPKGEAPFAASLGVRAPGSSEPAVISRRASSIGGLAVAPTVSRGKAEAVVLWVAEEKSGPQVYATRVDAAGKKVVQKKVTVVNRTAKGKAPSLASHVGIVDAPGPAKAKGEGPSEGYVAAWVDSRDGNGEVYAARLGKDLDKSVVDKRITTTKGNAADLSLAAHGGDVLLAFADAVDDAPSDIYFARVDAVTLQRKEEVARVYASTGVSRSPRLALFGSRIMLAWIEETPGEGRGTLRIGEVDPSGRLLSVAKTVEAPDRGSVNGLALTCTADGCRVVLSWSTEDGRLDMGGLRVLADGTPEAVVRLGTLSSGPFAEPSFSFADPEGTVLFFAEDLGDRGRVRQVELSWTR